VTGLVDFDIDCPWKDKVTVATPVSDLLGGPATLMAHYDDRLDQWEPVEVQRIENNVAYAQTTKLSSFFSGRMSATDLKWCKASNWNYLRCVTGFGILGPAAHSATFAKFGRSGDDDESDAWRHCYWNAIMTKSMGAGTAKTIGDNHEDMGPNYDLATVSPARTRMDLWNNAVGRQTGFSAILHCSNALTGGQLRRIDRGLFEPTGFNYTIGTPYSAPAPARAPAPSGPGQVTLSKGASAQGQPGCAAAACARMVVTGRSFAPNTSVTVSCASSSEGTFYTYYARVGGDGTTSTSTCYYGYPGGTTYAVINGIRSNNLTW